MSRGSRVFFRRKCTGCDFGEFFYYNTVGDKMGHMKIAVCDDEQTQQKLFEKYLREWAGSRKKAIDIRCFCSGESFLFAWEDEQDYDLLILDIEMGRVSGMELARRIRECNEEIPIMFATGYAEYMQCGYDVSAIQYLLKPIQKEKFFQVLDRIQSRKKRRPRLFLETEEGSIAIFCDDIWYAEAAGHRCILYTDTDSYTLKCSIGTLETQADGEPYRNFLIKCHRSYLVNVTHISCLAKGDLVMDNNVRLPVSRSFAKQVKDAFVTYYVKEGNV